jgi:hypothetical protein
MDASEPEILGDQLDLYLVKKRSVAGIIAITSRTFFLQLVALVANFLFGIFLLPEEYGVFYGVSAIIEFFVIFSDVGLAAALIQKKRISRRKRPKNHLHCPTNISQHPRSSGFFYRSPYRQIL